MTSRATIEFIGHFGREGFCEFVDHRAGRLDVHARVTVAGPRRIVVVVAGEPDMVDAFEMACSLGPIDCLVVDVLRRDGPAED